MDITSQMQTCNHTPFRRVPTSSSRLSLLRKRRRNSTDIGSGRHYRSARRQRSSGQKDLKDLLIDPQYDALFDTSGDNPSADPFSGPKQKSKKEEEEDREHRKLEAFLQRREKEMRSSNLRPDTEEYGTEDVNDLSHFEILKKYQRHYFLQEQQDEIMTHHHRMRESEVPPYAQATVLAGLLEQYDNMDEYLSRHPQPEKGGNPWLNAWQMIEDPDYNLDQDPLPAWMRAKRAIVKNWDAIVELNGNRQRTIERVSNFKELPPERQHMIDTWDPKLYEGTPDVEPEYEDYMDRFLAISEKTADDEEDQSEMDTVGSAFVDELLQMDDLEEEEE